MITAVQTPAQQQDFAHRITGRRCFAAVMGTAMELFGGKPASGWLFYLLPGCAALALRGGTAYLCGALPQDADTGEELSGFLHFLGVDTLLCEGAPPPGWQAGERLACFCLRRGERLTLPASPPPEFSLCQHPPMQAVAELVFPHSTAERDGFYSAACTAIAHGIGCCDALLAADGSVAATVGCYQNWGGEAYMTAGVTAPGHRKRGLAGWLIVRLANRLAQQGEVNFLCAQALVPWYQKLGFEKWQQIVKYIPVNIQNV